MKKLLTVAAALLLSVLVFAQVPTGGIKGTVVSRAGRVPVSGAEMVLSQDGRLLAEITSGSEGEFLIEGLADGVYQLTVTADEFSDLTVFVTVDKGFIKDLIFVSLTPAASIQEADESNFAEFDMEDSGYSDAPTLLLGSNDVYTNIAGFGFSSIRFKNRGYNSETQDVYLAGVKMNDAITGYSPFSLWSGLNEAMRSKDTTIGLETADAGFGGFFQQRQGIIQDAGFGDAAGIPDALFFLLRGLVRPGQPGHGRTCGPGGAGKEQAQDHQTGQNAAFHFGFLLRSGWKKGALPCGSARIVWMNYTPAIRL